MQPQPPFNDDSTTDEDSDDGGAPVPPAKRPKLEHPHPVVDATAAARTGFRVGADDVSGATSAPHRGRSTRTAAAEGGGGGERGVGARRERGRESRSRPYAELESLSREVSPPVVRKGKGVGGAAKKTVLVPSPVQLTRIRDLPDSANVDAVGLEEILGHPLVVECWQFNFMFDVDFLMGAFDEDVRGSVRVKVVHGSWRREDQQRVRMEEWSQRYGNLEVIQAYMPEAFGTHHSKMMVLIRADDCAQVVIHTANMIPKDWTNMTNGVWRSPLLPLLSTPTQNINTKAGPTSHPIGSGERFKVDLLRYLRAYGRRLNPLTEQLVNYDFSAIRAALIASTPDRVQLDAAAPAERTSWGWVGLREILRTVPIHTPDASSSTLVAQISSIATLGPTDAWLTHLRNVLASHKPATPGLPSPTTEPNPFNPPSLPSTPPRTPPPLRIIFPTASDVRTSLDGYASGTSIHFKTVTPAQQKQLSYLRPLLCKWNSGGGGGGSGSGTTTTTTTTTTAQSALRGPAAPHIKTYTRLSHTPSPHLDWAMLTSANLSTQAWGALPSAPKASTASGAKRKTTGGYEGGKEVRICSWEIGVVVWPGLLGGDVMVPVFGRDGPEGEGRVVGWRMPFDLPLVPYGGVDEAWCAMREYGEVDGRGCVWEGA